MVSLAMVIAVLSGNLALADTHDSGADLTYDATPLPAGDTVIVRVYYPDLDIGNKVLISFEPWIFETNYEEGYHLMEVTQREIDLLTDAGLQIVVAERQELPVIASIPGYPCYETVEETFDEAQGIVNDYPNLASWIDVGDSWEKTAGLGGYDMMVLVLTNSAISGDKPKFFATCAIHAREYTTAPLCLHFAHYLADNYGIDADATWILDYHEVHLMFHTNPDGRKQAEAGLSWRKNTNQNYCGATSNDRGVDLNRNFSFQWNCCGGSSSNECSETYHGPYAASEPETQAVQNYMRSIFPDQRDPNLNDPAPDDATGVYIDFHSYGKLVLWPWGFQSGAAPNGTQLQTLGRKFAYWNDYEPQQAIGLYPTDGTTDDFGYGDLGIAAYCFELGTAFFQSCSYYENTIVPDNMPVLIYAAKVPRTPYMTPAGPDAYNLSLSDDSVPAGTPVTLSGTVNDTRYNNSNGTEPTQNIATAEYYVDVPPWESGSTAIAMSASDGSFNEKTEDVEATMDTTGLSEGKHIIFVRGEDADGDWGAFSAIFLNLTGGTPPPPTVTPTPGPTDTPTPTPEPGVVFFDDFESDQGWEVNPDGSDTATIGMWERANPEGTEYDGRVYQLDTTASGSYDLVTGPLAGSGVGSYDIDGGDTTIRSPDITLPSDEEITLSFSYYLAHYNNATSDDYLRVKVIGSATATVFIYFPLVMTRMPIVLTVAFNSARYDWADYPNPEDVGNAPVFEELGARNTDEAAWATFTTSLDALAGQTVYLLIEAADGGDGSLVEAAIDDVSITSGAAPTPTPTGVPPTPTPTPGGGWQQF